MRPLLALLAASLLLAGCTATEAPGATLAGDGPGHAPPALLAFTEPRLLTEEGGGYEPSIEVDPFGAVYVTGHKGDPTREGTRLASWLWHSRDGGATWEDMPTPFQHHEKLFAFEGDLAQDAAGRLYYVDTYVADNTLSRWTLGPDGPAWDFTRPLHGTPGLDDRPWLAAQGDGVVYYLGNNGPALPAPNNLAKAETSRIWFHRSTDGGTTWTPGHGFAGSGWCAIDASRADDVTVYAGCTQGDRMVVHRSEDRGDTWMTTHLGELENGPGVTYPSVALDLAGNAYFAWIDGDVYAGEYGRLHLARTLNGAAWTTHDVTPFDGTFGMVWASGGPPGTVAITFYGTTDRKPGDATEWYAYILLGTGLDGGAPRWDFALLDPKPAGQGPYPPLDFFQNVIGPDGAVHVAYHRIHAYHPPLNLDSDILYLRQTAGPNLLPPEKDDPAPAPS